jgi:hypothetical protein
MAECSWTKPLARAALLIAWIALGVSTAVFPQSSSSSLTGKLTDLYSKPLEGASLTLRNQATGVESSTTTTKGGVYRFKGIEPGDYTLEALSPRLGHGSVSGIEVMAGHEERVQIAVQLTLEPRAEGPVSALARVLKPTPLTGNEAATGAASPPLIGSVLKIASHEIQETRAPASVVALETEPLNSLYLRALSTANPARQKALVTAGSDSKEPANPLPMATMSKLETRPDAALPALALVPLAEAAVAVAAIRTSGAASTGLVGSYIAKVAIQSARAAMRVSVRSPKSAIQAAESISDGVALATALPAIQLEALPVSGRNWQNFLPEASTEASGSESENSSPVRDGQGSSALTVDGANTRVAFGGTSAGRMKGQAASLIGPGASEAAIREVQMGSGSAEAGAEHGAAGRLNIETERGTRALHGQAFLFDRGNLLGAQNPFTQWVSKLRQPHSQPFPFLRPSPIRRRIRK